MAIDVRDTLFISILIKNFHVDKIYLDAGDLSMNIFSTLGESFLCGLVTAMKKLFV